MEDLINDLSTLSIEDKKLEKINKLKIIISKNKYVQNCTSNKKKDKNSLSYLIEKNLSQSDCIKTGIGMENIIKDIILHENKNLINIKEKNSKGDKEFDHLFKDDINKIIYYAELKSNLNLDTEKCKSTSNKCKDNLKILQEKYKDYKIIMFLVGLRYTNKNNIPRTIEKKYLEINNNLVGINEYLENLLNIKLYFDDITYKNFINILVNEMFK
jgi:hypothetical protein